jgi:hypothetical protein
MTIFCGLLPIGVGSQVKCSNDLVESLKEKRNRLRIEGSAVLQHALQRQCSTLGLWEVLRRGNCIAARFDRKGVHAAARSHTGGCL